MAAGDPLHGAEADPLTGSGDEIDLGEPLAESAAMARRLARRMCRPIGPGTPDCSPYHGLVQYLRLLGVVASPLRHGRFYREALREVDVARPRVLIAGAVDYGMLALVLDAYGERDIEVTVVDRCPTPLELCRWYASRADAAIATAVADVARFDDPGGFDVIVTDSILTLLRPDERTRTLSRWRALLAPGGRIVTSARVSTADYATDVAPEERVAAFAELIRERARKCEKPLDIEPDVLAHEALAYGTSVPVYPIRSPAEIASSFDAARLALDVVDVRELAGRVRAEQAGPGSYISATYARLVARAR